MTLETMASRAGMSIPVLVFVFGALVGSFLNVVIARLPDPDQSIVHPRSRCPNCEVPIAAWWNIPILSYLVLRGRCRHCKVTISPRYPMVELLTAVLFVACYSRFGPTVAFLAALILTGSLVAITFIDIDIYEIPDEISVPGIVIGMVLRPLAFDVDWYSGILGAVLGAGLLLSIRFAYFLWRDAEGMGMGDIKLLAMLGAFLGPLALIPVLFVGSFVGAIFGTILKIVELRSSEPEPKPEPEPEPEPEPRPRGFFAKVIVALQLTFLVGLQEEEFAEDEEEEEWIKPPTAVPFGPYLALGGFTALLFGPAIQRILFGQGLF